MQEREDDTGGRRRLLGAIDVGSNSIRLVVADVAPDGSYRLIDDEKVVTRLGHGLEENGALLPDRMAAAVDAVERLKGIAVGYGVESLRAVATCAVREASNGGEMARLVYERTGLGLMILPGDEEARLAYQSVASAFDLSGMHAAVVDIGGGSTEVVLSTNGVIELVVSLPLGAVRLTDEFGSFGEREDEKFRAMRRRVRRIVQEMLEKPESPPQLMFGTGGTFTNMAGIDMLRGPRAQHRQLLPNHVRGYEMEHAGVLHLCDWLWKMPVAVRAGVPGLSPDRADIIVSGIAIADRVMRHLGVNRLCVHDRGVRDGLLLSMIDEVIRPAGGAKRSPLTKPEAAVQFARKCRFEERHSMHVASIAVSFFDQLAARAAEDERVWFDAAHRDLLEAAGVLHDVGYLISYSKHHKHSYHLIVHSDMAGFTRRELEVVANVARYHRRAAPKTSHPSFEQLSKPDRHLVRMLSAILRVADGLDRTHTQAVTSVLLETEGADAVVRVSAATEPSVDIWGAERKSDLFEEVFGLRVRFEWVKTEAAPPASSEGSGRGRQNGLPAGAQA